MNLNPYPETMRRNTILRQFQVKTLEAAAAALTAKLEHTAAEKGLADKKTAAGKKERKPMDVRKLNKPSGKKRGVAKKPAKKKPLTEEEKTLLHKLSKCVSFQKANRHNLCE